MTIAVVAVVATISVSLLTDDSGSVHQAKLQSDVATLNQMVTLYLADGGDLSGLTNPQTILDKMKRVRPQAEWQRHIGAASGRLLDVRLRARLTNELGRNEQVRATWNRLKQRFELTNRPTGDAVSEFYLDESLAATDFGTETRRSTVKTFNSGTRGWVWSAATQDPTASYINSAPVIEEGAGQNFDPAETAPPSGPPSGAGGSGGGAGGGGGGSEGGGGMTPPTTLPVPSISPGGGTYSFASFPANVTISRNGAPPASSKLMVRINGGSWTEFAGGTFSPLLPAMRIEARNESTSPSVWNNSSITSNTFYRLALGFTGGGTGSWGNATGGPNLVRTIENGSETSTFKHGNTKLDLGNGQYLDAGVENVLTFTRENFDTIVPNTWFKFGELAMLNGTTFYDSEATGVTLSVNLGLSQPNTSMVTHINLGLVSTENTSDRLASADIVELRNPATDVLITIDGVQYTMELSWATLDPGAGVVQGNQFLIFEGSSARAELRARFKSNR